MNFNDQATKEALRMLSDLYVTPVPATGTLKGKEVWRGLDELEDGEAEDDILGKSSRAIE